MKKTNKALFIDVVNKTITTIELDKHFKAISKAIGNGCEYFCCPYSFFNDDSLYADDEALLRMDSIKGGFTLVVDYDIEKLDGKHIKIVGNAIILGTDAEGDSVDANFTPEDIADRIIFFDENVAKDYAKEIMATKPTFFSF